MILIYGSNKCSCLSVLRTPVRIAQWSREVDVGHDFSLVLPYHLGDTSKESEVYEMCVDLNQQVLRVVV